MQVYKKLLLCVVLAVSAKAQDDDIWYLFSHGIADSHKQAFYYTGADPSQGSIIKGTFITFDYPDVSNSIFRMNRTQTSLGQKNEIDCLAQVFFQATYHKRTILIGVSRGASTALNFMAFYNPENVAALILESPFDCVESIITHLAHETRCSWVPGFKKYGPSLLPFIFCKYNPQGIRPIDCISAIRQDLPILIICSLQDMLVPAWSSLNVYTLLRETGHYNTFLLMIPEGRHAKLITHAHAGPLYQNMVHAFYRKFELPYNPLFAEQGAPLLAASQPDISALDSYFPWYCLSNKSHNRTHAKNK